MSIKVLHSFPVWLPQTQTWMYNQVRYLPDDIEPHIVCERTENLDQFQVPNLHSLAEQPAWRRYVDRGIRKLRLRRHLGFAVKTARKHRVDIVHSHFGPIGWVDMSAVRRTGARHVVTFYGRDVNQYPQQDSRWLARYENMFAHLDAVLCEGPHMAACVADLGCPEDKIHVQHLGIALGDIPFAPYPWRSGEPLQVMIAAAFRQKKGIPYALEALGRLKEKVPLEITLIGDAGDDPDSAREKRAILEAIDRFGLTSVTGMIGFQPHSRLLEEARRHHIFLSPSVTADDGDTEGGAPVSLIEMSASGMLVVSTTHCDIPEIVKHGETGLLAKERDVEGLVANMEWLLEHPDRWNDFQTAARKHVENGFDAKNQGATLAEIYRKLFGQGQK